MRIEDMAGHLIRRLNQISTHVFQTHLDAAGYTLTSVQFAAMAAIRDTPGLDQASIAAQIAYDRATIGGVIERLEQKGYVTRKTSKRDRRAREVALTPKGTTVFDQIFPIVAKLQSEILEGLDPAEQQTFLDLARKAVAGGEARATPEAR